MITVDAQAILTGQISRETALWHIGRTHLGHTNNVLAVARGDRKVWSFEWGEGPTNVKGVYAQHDTKGVILRSSVWRDPDGSEKDAELCAANGSERIFSSETLWSCRWEEVTAILRPHLVGDVLTACQEAAAARRAYIDEHGFPYGTPIEDACYSTAAAAWAASEPAEQFALF